MNRSFFLILISQFLTKLGDSLMNAKTVLPWLLSALGAPNVFSGLLVPIRESGSLLPQIILANVVKRFHVRKWFFVIACFIQAVSVAAIALFSDSARGWLAGVIILSMLVVFSLGRSVCSLVSKDVLGKTIEENWRGKVSGYSVSASGIITVITGVVMVTGFSLDTQLIQRLLMIASLCWVAAGLVYGMIDEPAGETEQGENPWQQFAEGFRLIREDKPFRQFLLTRCLLMSSGLGVPFVIVMAQRYSEQNQNEAIHLGVFIALGGIASVVSGWFWGVIADRSSRLVLLITALLVSLLYLLPVLIDINLLPHSPWLFFIIFFLLMVTHEGVRLGRKTYVVNMADGNQRTDYVAISNSMIGLLLLTLGGVVALIAQFSLIAVFAILSLASFLAWVTARDLSAI